LKKIIPLARRDARRRRGSNLPDTSGICPEIKMGLKIFLGIRTGDIPIHKLTANKTAQGILHRFLQRQIQLHIGCSWPGRFRRGSNNQNDNNRQRSAQKDADAGEAFVVLITIEAHKNKYRQIRYPGADFLF
jgi:hypothetical protein